MVFISFINIPGAVISANGRYNMCLHWNHRYFSKNVCTWTYASFKSVRVISLSFLEVSYTKNVLHLN